MNAAAGWSQDDFIDALFDGVRDRRFVEVRNSYLLVNKDNEAYDPRAYKRWLDDEGFSSRQRSSMWHDYDYGFGLLDVPDEYVPDEEE